MTGHAAGRAAAAVIVLGAAARFFRLDLFALGFDEAISVKCASAPCLRAVWGIPPAHARPFTDLWNSLLHFWMVLGGDPATIRALPALLGAVVLVLAWRILRDILPPAPAVAALALFAFSPFQVQYAQEARPYMLTLACEFGAVLALGKAVAGKGSPAWWAAWAALCAAASLSHLVALGWIAASAAWVLLRPGRRRYAWPLAAWGAAAAAPALVLAAADARGLAHMNAVGSSPVPARDFLIGIVSFFGPGAWVPAPAVLPALVVFGLAMGLGAVLCVFPRRRDAAAARLSAAVAAFGLVPLALVIAGHWAGVVYLPKLRYAMASQLFLLAAASRAAWAAGPRWARAIVLGCLLGLDAVSLVRYFGGGFPTLDLPPCKKPFHEVASDLAARARGGDGVLSYGMATYLPLDYHLAGRLPHGYFLRDPIFGDGELHILGFPSDAAAFVRSHRSVWVVVAPVTYRGSTELPGDLAAILRRGAIRREEILRPGIRIERWEARR